MQPVALTDERRFGGRRIRAGAAAFVAVAALTAAAYMAWLGWDREYDVDPATGVVSGPYQPWQVIGLAVCLGVVAFAAGWLGRRRICALAMPVTFTVCFGINASTSANDDGLWVVGMVLAYIGVLLGAMLVGVLGELAVRLRSARAA